MFPLSRFKVFQKQVNCARHFLKPHLCWGVRIETRGPRMPIIVKRDPFPKHSNLFYEIFVVEILEFSFSDWGCQKAKNPFAFLWFLFRFILNTLCYCRLAFPFPTHLCVIWFYPIRFGDIFSQFHISRRSIRHLNKSDNFAFNISLARKSVYYLFARIYLVCWKINFPNIYCYW